MSSARAEADHADFAAGIRLRTQIGHGTRDIALDLFVGGAPGRSRTCRDIVRAAGAESEKQMRRDGGIAAIGELAYHLGGPFVPPWHVMDDDHAWDRSGAQRASVIGFAFVAVMATKTYGLCMQACVPHIAPQFAQR